MNYFKETKQYVLICENDNKFTVILFNKDFQVLNPDNITTSNFEILNHYTFNSITAESPQNCLIEKINFAIVQSLLIKNRYYKPTKENLLSSAGECHIHTASVA